MIGFGLATPTVALTRSQGARAPAIAVPTALLMSNRSNVLGFGGYGNSSGDTDSNTRLSHFNQTGTGVTRLRAYFANWRANATNEQAGPNPFTLTASIEYPAGTFQALTFGGSASTTLAVDDLRESDELALSVPIPAGAQFWVRTYVTVTSGLVWPLGYAPNTARGEAVDFSTTVDKTLAGTITNATPTTTRRGFGPIGIKATGFVGTPVKRAFASVGDSVLMFAGDGNYDAIGSGGWNGRALSGVFPHVNFAITGTAASSNLPAVYTRRLAALRVLGVTDVLCDFSHNDISGGRTVAQLEADLAAIWANFVGAGLRVHQTTSLPRTSSTDGWKTVANQAAYTPNGGYTGGVSSRRHLFNQWVRSKPGPLSGVVDIAAALEADATGALLPGGGLWLAAPGASVHLTTTGATTDAATGDGQHPNVTGVGSPYYGGHYVLKDVFAAYLAGLPS